MMTEIWVKALLGSLTRLRVMGEGTIGVSYSLTGEDLELEVDGKMNGNVI